MGKEEFKELRIESFELRISGLRLLAEIVRQVGGPQTAGAVLKQVERHCRFTFAVGLVPLESSRSCHLGFKLLVEKSDAVGDRFF